MLTKQDLMKARTRALRKGVWFGALSRVERSLVNLTIQCVRRVHSDILMRAVMAILGKLRDNQAEDYLKKVERTGREIAEKICEIASRWGNPQAWTWKYDLRFVKFLGVSPTNS